ncbi:MAG: glycosyltransferase family 39 protein [Rhizobiaceae bacterium]
MISPVEEPLAEEGRGNSVEWKRLLLISMTALLALRIVSLWFNNTELFFDEAQYWAWGKEPAFGYFSKPPMLAWLIGSITGLLGDSEFAVRLLSPLMHTATAYLVWRIARTLFDRRTGFFAAFTYLTLPAVTLSSTVVSTDVPLLFFWSLALFAFIGFRKSGSWRDAALLAMALGLGLLSKYAMIYFLLCIAIFLIFSRQDRGLLRQPRFWMAILGGLALLTPNLIWNMQNAFATVGHTGENIGWDGRLHFLRLAEFLGSQFGVMGPVLFGIFFIAIFRLIAEGMDSNQRLLLAFSVPVLALICFQALMSKAYANWAAVTYIAATILVADLLVNRIPDWWNRLSLGIHLCAFAVLSVAVAFSLPGQLPLPDEANPFRRMQGAREIAARVEERLKENSYSAILTDNRKFSSLMIYYLRDAGVPVKAWLESGAPSDHFQMSRPFQEDPAEPVLYVTNASNAAPVLASFTNAVQLATEAISAGEIPRVWLYDLRGYQRQVQ